MPGVLMPEMNGLYLGYSEMGRSEKGLNGKGSHLGVHGTCVNLDSRT